MVDQYFDITIYFFFFETYYDNLHLITHVFQSKIVSEDFNLQDNYFINE